MIFVDAIARGRTPWRGGAYCHMISDTSVGELLDFAAALGLHSNWLQHGFRSFPHYDLTPGWRAKAMRLGATYAVRRDFVSAMRRFRERNPEIWTPNSLS